MTSLPMFSTLATATAKVGQQVRVSNGVVDGVYVRLDQRSAYSKRRAEFGYNSMWEQVRATISPEGNLDAA